MKKSTTIKNFKAFLLDKLLYKEVEKVHTLFQDKEQLRAMVQENADEVNKKLKPKLELYKDLLQHFFNESGHKHFMVRDYRPFTVTGFDDDFCWNKENVVFAQDMVALLKKWDKISFIKTFFNQKQNPY